MRGKTNEKSLISSTFILISFHGYISLGKDTKMVVCFFVLSDRYKIGSAKIPVTVV